MQRIDKDSQQLADAIDGGVNIIITTLQKFPHVIDKVRALPDRKYAVIIDEAHSSHGGESSKKMKEVLSSQDSYRVEEPNPTLEDDPNINKKKAAQAIGRFVSLHLHNLAQKTEIIIEHFRQIVATKIGGRAKAMLVTGSKLHAKCYISEKSYEKEIKILVAFSGKVIDDNFPDGVTEPQLTEKVQSQLYTYIYPAVDRYKAIETEKEKSEF